MNDYHATLKIRQGRIISLMRDVGIHSVKELSRRSGVNCTELYQYVNFKKSPRTTTGEWRKNIFPLCKALAAEPLDVFPIHLDKEIPTNHIEAFADDRQLAGFSEPMLLPSECIDRDNLRNTLETVLATLEEREANVIRQVYYDGRSLAEIGGKYKVTRERVRQIHAKAIRKLRHPTRIRRLESALDFNEETQSHEYTGE